MLAHLRLLLALIALWAPLTPAAQNGAPADTPSQAVTPAPVTEPDVDPSMGPEDPGYAALVEKLEDLVQGLETGLGGVRDLNGALDSAAENDREALLYRRDERGFALLADIATLAREVARLSPDDPLRERLTARLREDLAGAGDLLLERTVELDQRIGKFSEEAQSLSGPDQVAMHAYVYALKDLRIDAYRATVDLIESRQALDLPADKLLDTLSRHLYLHAETLVGRLRFYGAAVKEMQARLKNDAQNADLAAAEQRFALIHSEDLAKLQAIIELMKRLGLDNSAYKSVILQQGEEISIRDLERDVVLELLRDAWQSTRETFVDSAPDVLFDLGIVLVVLLVFRVLARLTRRGVVLACERSGENISTLLKDVLASVSSGVIMVFGLLIALAQVGISLGPALAGLGVAGFIIGFALQDTLGNFASGGMILLYRPYDVDDFVEVAGASGLVKKMSLVSTTITTFDNQTLVVPNSKIWGDVIKNVTAQKVRRVDMEFGIGYGDDIPRAEHVLAEIVENHEAILKKPEPTIKVHSLGDSSVNFIVRPWVKTTDYWPVYWDVTRAVKLRFDEEGISIPFPQRDVHLYSEVDATGDASSSEA